MDNYDKQRKRYYDKHRVKAKHFKSGEQVIVDFSVGKTGNVKKMSINRKRAVIVDKISDNAYTVRYDTGKYDNININRLYGFPQQEEEEEEE